MLPTQPIDAAAGDVAWMAGRWVGEYDGDRIEEWWSEPHAGMLLGMFRWHRDGEPRFYELMSMEPTKPAWSSASSTSARACWAGRRRTRR